MKTDTPKKRGRPPKDRSNLIFYRSGRRIKAFNPEWGVDVNFSEKDMKSGMTVYKSLGYDWTRWGSKQSGTGFYNAARSTPFLPPSAVIAPDKIKKLEADYRDCPQLKRVMDALSSLFDGKRPYKPILLHGGFWVQTIGSMFINDAGIDGLGRFSDERPYGKIWCSVITLQTNGSGVNYTLEPWLKVINMTCPPVFCIRIDSDEDSPPGFKLAEDWRPTDLSTAILQSLWATKDIDSCSADAGIVEMTPQPSPVAFAEATPSEDTPEPTPPLSGDPDAVPELEGKWQVIPPSETQMADALVLEAEVLSPVRKIAEATPEPEAVIIPEAIPTATDKTWGEIKQTPIWMKGLSTSKELQAPATLARVLDTVVSHEATKRLTDDCRTIADKKERNEYKRDNLHVWYPSAVFAGRAGGSSKENLVGYTGFACLDLDGMKSFEEAQDTRDEIFMEFPEVLFAAVSASGLGVYALVVLDFDGTEAGFKAALSGAMESFEAKGYMPDTGCSDPTRARYMSSDPDALQRPDNYAPNAFSASEEGGFILPATMLRSCWTNSGRKKKGAGKIYLEEALHRIETAPDGMKDTTLTSVMGSVARLIRNYDMNAEKTYDMVRKVARECGYDERKTADKIRRLGVKNTGDTL